MIQEINLKNILRFTLPVIATMLFTSIYVMVDGVFVANLINETALAAVNIVFPIVSIVLAIGLMIGTGGSALYSRLLGEGKNKEAKEKFTILNIFALIMGLLILFVVRMNLENIIYFLGANDQNFHYCYEYMNILSWFIPFLIYQVIFQTAFVSANKPIYSLIAMLLGGISNIVLDYLFMGPFNMGVGGAAIATGIGYTIPTIIGFAYFTKSKNRTLNFVKVKFEISTILHACGNGSSEMVTNLSIAVTTFLFNVAMLRLVGTDGVSAITVILYLQYFLQAVYTGYSMGIAPVISYNYGERNHKNLRSIYIYSIKIILCISILATTLSMLFASNLVSIFTSPGSEVYNLAFSGLKIFVIGFLFSGINIFASVMFTSYSNGFISATISISRTFVFIALSLLFLPEIIGINGVWLAVPISEFLTIIIAVLFMKHYQNKYLYNDLNEKVVVKEHNIITITREFGSGGREIAKRLSEKLGYNYYDDEIVKLISKESKLAENYIEKFSEVKKNRNNYAFAASFKIRHESTSERLQLAQAKVIKELATKGDAIFVGRCSDYILKDYEPMKIFIFSSDINTRIDRCYEKVPSDKIHSRKAMKNKILKIDKERLKYYETYTGVSRNDLANYNLTFDTSKIDVKDVVDMISSIYKNK